MSTNEIIFRKVPQPGGFNSWSVLIDLPDTAPLGFGCIIWSHCLNRYIFHVSALKGDSVLLDSRTMRTISDFTDTETMTQLEALKDV